MPCANPTQNIQSPKLDVLLASICYLLSRYALEPTPQLSRIIAEHFERLHRHPGNESAILKSTGKRLSLQWAQMICERCSKNAQKLNAH